MRSTATVTSVARQVPLFAGNGISIFRNEVSTTSSHLQNAWNRYGPAAFMFGVLESVPASELLQREQYYFDVLKPEYNMSPIASSRLGATQTEETKRKMSEAKRGHAVSDEAKLKIGAASRARMADPEYHRKWREAQRPLTLQVVWEIKTLLNTGLSPHDR